MVFHISDHYRDRAYFVDDFASSSPHPNSLATSSANMCSPPSIQSPPSGESCNLYTLPVTHLLSVFQFPSNISYDFSYRDIKGPQLTSRACAHCTTPLTDRLSSSSFLVQYYPTTSPHESRRDPAIGAPNPSRRQTRYSVPRRNPRESPSRS